MRFIGASVLSLLCSVVFADFKTVPAPTLPDGTRLSIDLPADQHMRNSGGNDRTRDNPLGLPGRGFGLCVFSSAELAESRWQNGVLAGFQKWMQSKPGGGSPRKLQAMITQFCNEKGLREPDYVQHTGSDMVFLETAVKTRRMAAVTYAGSDDFYSGPIDHMVNLHWLDANYAVIQDNNRPQRWTVMSRREFETRWKARGGGWAVVFLNSPPPPSAPSLQSQTLTTSAEFKDLNFPRSQVVLREEVGLQQRYGSGCRNGNCPTAVYPSTPTVNTFYPSPQPTTVSPKQSPAVSTQWTDRSSSSVLVTRSVAVDRSESGTGTVIASRNSESLILTNAHVAEDGTRPITVTTKSGQAFTAKYVAGSKVTHTSPTSIEVEGPDLALVSVSAELPVVPIASELPPSGLPVCQWGYGQQSSDRGPTFKTGKTLDAENYVGQIQRTTIPSQSGDSGSGIFNEKGQLVAVCWGGRDGTQFAVRLDAVHSFLEPYLKGSGDLVGELVEDSGTNHGINLEELNQHTKGGKKTYWINGREVGRPQALDAVSAGGLGLVDDSDRYHLSIVTSDSVTAKVVLADPRLSSALGKVHVQVYSPTDWVARDRLKSVVTLQEPSPKGGKVIWTAEVLDVTSLAEGLKRADPNWKPEPPAPTPAPPPVNPEPTPNTPVSPSPSLPTPLLILLVLTGLYFLLPKKVN